MNLAAHYIILIVIFLLSMSHGGKLKIFFIFALPLLLYIGKIKKREFQDNFFYLNFFAIHSIMIYFSLLYICSNFLIFGNIYLKENLVINLLFISFVLMTFLASVILTAFKFLVLENSVSFFIHNKPFLILRNIYSISLFLDNSFVAIHYKGGNNLKKIILPNIFNFTQHLESNKIKNINKI